MPHTGNRMFKKILLLFAAIIVPLLLLDVFIYAVSVRSYTKLMQENQQQRLDNFTQTMANEFDRVKRNVYNTLGDDPINRALNFHDELTPVERTQLYNQIYDALFTIGELSEYVGEVNCYFTETGEEIGSNGGFDVSDPGEAEQIVRQTYGGYYYDGTLHMVCPLDLPTVDQLPRCFITVELPNDILGTKVDEFARLQQSGARLLLYGQTIYATGSQRGTELAGQVDENVQMVMLWQRGPGDGVLHNVYATFVAIALLAGVMCALFILYLYRHIQRPLDTLVTAFEHLEKGDFAYRVENKAKDEFQYIYQAYNHMSGELSGLLKKGVEQERLLQNAELRQMQAQINPHFLYNTLFLLKSMARMGDEEGVCELSEHLGNYFAYISRGNSQVVTLAEELEHARNYAAIQRMRYVRTVTLALDEVPAEYADHKVPRLILQPLLENAFKYAADKYSNIVIRMRFVRQAGGLDIVVEDSGHAELADIVRVNDVLAGRIQPKRLSALINIDRRLRLFFGEDSGLHVSMSELGGFAVTMQIRGEGSGCIGC